jgi:hypothetical protein
LDVPQTLELACVNDAGVAAWNKDILVNFVTNHSVPHRHPQTSLCSTIKKRDAFKLGSFVQARRDHTKANGYG